MTQEGKLSGPGTIEVAGFSRVFRTRSMAWPDLLFLPLADQVRQALAIADTLTQVDPTKREDAILIAERYLSGCLLQDSNYLISAPGMSQDDCYQIDVKAGVLQFRSMMYAGQGQRTSSFKIQVSGDIRKGEYSVKSPTDGPAILMFSQTNLNQPEFFSKTLAPLCLVNTILRQRASHPDNSSMLTQKIQLTLPVQACGLSVSVPIRNDGATQPWQVFDPLNGREIGVISPESLKDVDQLLETLTTLLANVAQQQPDVPVAAAVEAVSSMKSKTSSSPAIYSARR